MTSKILNELFTSWTAIFLMVLSLAMQPVQADIGGDWLATQYQTDGSIDNGSGVATAYQATSETLLLWYSTGDTARTIISPALQFLATENYGGTEYLARLIVAKAKAGQSVAELADGLLPSANFDGGFGELPGYDSTVLDTAFALQALQASGKGNVQQAYSAAEFLLGAQQPDGGWTVGDNAASAYITAQAIIALTPYVNTLQAAPGGLAAAGNFLLSQRGGDGLWVEDHLSALALIALVGNGADLSAIKTAAEALAAKQSPGGSWSNDVYTTALALRALALYNVAYPKNPGGGNGTITGHAFNADSLEPLANVEILLDSLPGYSVMTDAAGFFRMGGVPAGMQTVSARKNGYLGASKAVPVFDGQSSDAGIFALQMETTVAVVNGYIDDGQSHAALAGVTVTLTGAQATRSTVTDGNGKFEVTELPPGDYALHIALAGYYEVNAALSVAGGANLSVRQSLLKLGAYLDDTPGDISGKVVDGENSAGLAGAKLDLGNGLVATTASDGSFVVHNVPRGAYQGTLSAAGYQSQSLSFVFNPGASGELGTLRLYRTGGAGVPTSLTLSGKILDGVSGVPVSGASVEWVGTGKQVQSAIDGSFVMTGIDTLSMTLNVTGSGYLARTFTLSATGFGEVYQQFSLPPDSGNPAATSSTVGGTVKDAATGQPIAGAKVDLLDGQGFSATTGSAGQFEFSGITNLNFSLAVSANGYTMSTRQLALATHGNYLTDFALEPQSAGRFQVVSLNGPPQVATANQNLLFSAEIANLQGQDDEVLVVGEIVNAAGTSIAKVTPFAPGTTTLASQFSFAAGQSLALTVPWDSAQNAPGVYRLILRVVEPGTISASLPFGQVLAENQAFGEIAGSLVFSGALGLDPPLTQAGSQTPVKLNALVVNTGNSGLGNVPLTLSVTHPQTGAILHQATATLDSLAVNGHRYLSFGEWTPSTEGNLPLRISASDGAVQGEIAGTLYVGDKAAGEFTVDKTIVPEGTQTLHGQISLKGVDTAIGSAIDPLFKRVQDAVKTGGAYTANGAMVWQKSNGCLGCHIQTQSLVGVASAFQKRLGDEASAINLYNMVASAQQDDGGLRSSHPWYTKTQTALGAWSLTAWKGDESFRTLYRAAQHLYDRRSQSGNQTWWSADHASGWWYSDESHTAMTTKAFAKLLKSAETIDTSKLNDYRLDSRVALGSGSGPRDVESAADGYLYTVKQTGDIVRIDPNTNTVENIAKLSIDGYGIAVAKDGTIYVSGNYGKLLRRNVDGTIDTLLSSGAGYLTDVEIGPDGRIYVVDYSNSRILRRNDSGQWETWVSGGALYYPYGMAFAANGDIYIANGNYNIIKVDTAKKVTVFTDGIAYRPLYIDDSPDGGFYFSTYVASNNGQYTPWAINSLSAKGLVERLASKDGTFGVGVMDDGRVFAVNANDNGLYQLTKIPLDTSHLPNYATEVSRAANYFLARYKDGTADNIVQAMRLTGLAEARKVVTDAALNAQIDTAMTAVGNTLRARQNSDGGWGRYTGWGSDAMVTALVGLALDYTNPSADDLMVRKTIEYLLATQLGDHSWYSSNGILGTRLAATSLVVTYLPIALERLGGIDVDLHVNFPASVALSKPSSAPTSQTANAAGGIDYLWKLVGVTANKRLLDFDLALNNMALQEQRSVADAAYIEFANSFTSEKLRVDLGIPTVKAASGLGLSLATDRSSYAAGETVLIRPTVANTGPTVAGGNVEVSVRAAGATENLAVLAPLAVPDLTVGASLGLETPWNTGTTLVGNYEAHARLLDSQGRVVDEATAPFQIVAGATALIDGRVITDKPVYAAWDSVSLDARVENTTANAIQPPSLVEITVAAPDGQLIFNQSASLGELLPGALRDLNFSLNLVDAASGDYPVTMTVKDAFSHAVLITRATVFRVDRQAIQALSGKVDATPLQVHQGDPASCLEHVQNNAASALPGVMLTSQLARVADQQILSAATRTVDFAANAQSNETRSIATGDLALGTYACILLADVAGQQRQLGAALFDVLEPPVRIDASLKPGAHGRVLVLLDDAAESCDDDDDHDGHRGEDKHSQRSGEHDEDGEDDDNCGSDTHETSGDDPHGPDHRPALDIQRTYLESLLKNAGWSYTIATDADGFTRELRSGGYVAYLLLSESVKLSEPASQELREAVNRGEGLVEAGGHDQRQGRIDEALGVKFKGKYPHMTGIVVDAGGFTPAGPAALQLRDKTLRFEPKGATALGWFQQDSLPLTKMALAERAYGQGRTVLVGYDLLAEASLPAADPRHGQLLLDALSRVQPQKLAPLAQLAYPLHISLANKGIATPGRVLLTLPADLAVVDAGGATRDANRLIWSFDLAKDATAAFTTWVKLPETPVTFSATIESGTAGQYKPQGELTLNVEPQLADDLQAALDAIAPLTDKAYKQARRYLQSAAANTQAGNWPETLENLRRAAEALIAVDTIKAAGIRLSTDRAMRTAAMKIPAS